MVQITASCQAIFWTNAGLMFMEQISMKFLSKHNHFYLRKWNEKCSLRNGGHVVFVSVC